MKKVNYPGSMHDLATRSAKFTIPDCSGVYYIKRLNEFMDCVLMVDDKEGWINAGTISIRRSGELTVSLRKHGITYEKRFKLSELNAI